MTISRALAVRCTQKHFLQVFLEWHSHKPQSKYRISICLVFTDFVLRLCFVKLKLLLLAIEFKPIDGGYTKISINPQSSKMPANTVGFFIAQSAEEVKRWNLSVIWLMDWFTNNMQGLVLLQRLPWWCKGWKPDKEVQVQKL